MAKHNDKRRAEKKAKKERKRKLAVKKKIENIKKSERETNKQATEMRDTLNGIQADIKSQVENIDGAKKIFIALESFTYNVTTKRLDLPYLTDEIKERFKGIHENILATLKHVDEIRKNFIETALKIQDPGALRADMESLKKYSEVLHGAQELMAMQSSVIDFGAECGRVVRDLNNIIKECDELRKQHGDFSIMPIATPEELKFLGLNFNYEKYEFENKDGEEIDIPYTNGHDESVETEDIVEKNITEESIEDAVIVNNIDNLSELSEEPIDTTESETVIDSIEEKIKE